ncbi:MAG TPA: hypothetical protein VHF28_04710 [Nitrososphaera sp.]|nr:hypothetical protein [Nitrososphaera sp.]
MSNLNSAVVDFFSSIILTFVFAGFVFGGNAEKTYAHFFGATKNVDNYQVIFAPSPSTPVAGDNSTVLNFSVLENNSNIYNLYVAMVVADKESGDVIGQIPYRFQEFSDITIPYVFNDTGTYEVTLQTRITGDDKYQNAPLVVSFDISVGNQLIPFDELMLFYVTPATAATAGIAIYLHSKKKI